MSNTRQPQSIFPDYPREQPAIDKEGNLVEGWDIQLGALFQALQTNFKNEGIMVPWLTDTQLSTIQSLYTSYIGQTYQTLTATLPDISGQMAFDITNKINKQFYVAVDASSPPKVTLAQWVPFSMMLTHAGNPNTAVAGVLNWFCYDITNKVLYICTTAGNAASAVWTTV